MDIKNGTAPHILPAEPETYQRQAFPTPSSLSANGLPMVAGAFGLAAAIIAIGTAIRHKRTKRSSGPTHKL